MVAKYPPNETAFEWKRSNERWIPKIQLHGTADTKLTSKYSYMFSRLRDKYDVLEEQINTMGDLIGGKLQIEEFESNNNPKSVVTYWTCLCG